MNDIVKAVCDDYKEYVRFCEKRNIKPLQSEFMDFYKHWEEIKETEKWNWKMDWCSSRGLSPAFKCVWDEAERVYQKHLKEIENE